MCHTEMCYRTCFMGCLSIQIASLIIMKHNILHNKSQVLPILKKLDKKFNQQANETKGINNTDLISYQQISLILLQQWNTKHNSFLKMLNCLKP